MQPLDAPIYSEQAFAFAEDNAAFVTAILGRTRPDGGGDSYYTDGEVKFSVLVDGCGQQASTATAFADPPLVEAKNHVWKRLAGKLRFWIGLGE